MRTVVQRVRSAQVSIEGTVKGAIGRGLVVFVGIGAEDNKKDLQWLAEKIVHLRIFEDDTGKMNNSLTDIKGEMLIISQFTLYGDCRKGRRPGFSTAAPPSIAEPYYHEFVQEIRNKGIQVATGTFQADMQVELINDGPVTLLLDSEKKF